MKIFFAILLAFSFSVFSFIAGASANKPKPGQTSTTCYYNLGQKVGQTENLKGLAKPVLIGRACSDGDGNSGIAVLDQEDEEAEEAEEAAKAAALQAKKTQSDSNLVLSSTCQFNQGPRAGQVENYKGKIQPMPVGSPCTDGLRSIGVAIPD